MQISEDLLHNLTFILYLQRGFIEAQDDDGLLEILGFKQGWHASFVVVELICTRHIAQVLDYENPIFYQSLFYSTKRSIKLFLAIALNIITYLKVS